MRITVCPAIFQQFSSARIAVIAGWGLNNHQTPPEVIELLRTAEEAVRSCYSLEELSSLGQITDWRDAYRTFGMKPSSYRSSIEALLRRVLQGKDLPSISPVVDLYNIVSLKHLLPAGAMNLDAIQGDVTLTVANGQERFIRLGGEAPENIQPGEVIYRDDDDVLCRAWNYRESEKSKITPSSRNVCLFLEGLDSTSTTNLVAAQTEMQELLKTYCGGSYQLGILSLSEPHIALGDPS